MPLGAQAGQNIIMYFVVLLIFGAFLLADGQSPFNAAFRKRVTANVTCGSPVEIYFRIQDAMLFPQQRIEKTCNASDEKYSHPPSYMVDGSMGTFWQSTKRTSDEKDKAYIEIDLRQTFFAYQIKMIFGDYQRPGATAISKSKDYGASFTPYHYLVTYPGKTECPSVFGIANYAKGTTIDRIDEVLCEHYELHDALDYNETVSVELNGRRVGDGAQNSHSPDRLAWLNITNVRFTFSGMHLKLDKGSYNFHHYTVREIEILARCNCNGHADGNVCPQDETTKKRACQCHGNTCGDNCEICCPLYNQKPWTKGSKAPWQNDPKVSCEPCNCHNHSDACVYNQTVNDLSTSLDIHGNRSGGGVCLDCKNHTRGINCEKCEEFYYSPGGRGKTRQDVCQACSCDVRGTHNASVLAFLDCVTDEEELSNHPGKVPGDCYCKANVDGPHCDKCNSEYFNLTRDNPEGCSECRCHLPGSVNGSNVCNASEAGQCPCKTQVGLRDCSQCKHGYYNLSNESDDGCESCDCDDGGTYPANTCDKVSGQCRCRANVIGKHCKQVPDGFYYPDLHFLKASRDPYKSAYDNIHAWLYIPKTTNYRLFLHDAEGNFVLSSNESLTSSFNKTAKELKDCTYSSRNNSYCLLLKGNYSVNVTLYSAHKLESIIAVPEEFITASVFEEARRPQFLFRCSVTENDKIGKKNCLAGIFSLTVAFNNGTLPCSCHPLGSVNHTICQKYGGSCTCRPGVEGRDCSRCVAGYYNLTEDGCKPCTCNGPNKVCHPVSGMCECPGNTTGRTCEPCQCNNNTNHCLRSGECLGCQYNTTGFYCDKCVNQTYGVASKQQCKACECNVVGSYGLPCNIQTGQCVCKPYATGRTCSRCKNNTFGFGSQGCTACNCSAFGSLSLQCNDRGNCTCQPEASGIKCSQCKLGYYGLPTQSCAACSCNTNGTINGTMCSSDARGQCECKRGMTGRACDQCKKYHMNLSDLGCSSCSQCVIKLKKTLTSTKSKLNATDKKAKQLKELVKLHEPLQKAEQKADQSAIKAKEFSDRLAEARTEHQRLHDVELPQERAAYEELLRKANETETRAPTTAHNVSSHLKRVTGVHNRTVEAAHLVNSADELLEDIANALALNLQNGNLFLNNAKHIVSDSLVRDYNSNEKLIAQAMKDADNLTAFVTGLARKLFNQTSLARDLNAQLLTNNQNLSQLVVAWNSTHDEFIGFLTEVKGQFDSVYDLINQTQGLLSLESQRLKEAQDLGSQSGDLLNKTKSSLQEATSAFEDMSQIESGTFKPTSGLADVSNLLLAQYEKVAPILGNVEVKLIQAHQNAQQLKALAEQLELEFNNSQSHGAAALHAVQRYTEIERIINASFHSLSRAQLIVVRIRSELNRVSTSELLAKANNELHAITVFYNATLQRNISSHEKAFIEHAISTANTTIRHSVQQWHEAYSYYPTLVEAEAMLSLATSLYAPGAVETVNHAQERTNHVSESVTRLSQQVSHLELQLTDVFSKIEFVKNSSERDSKVVQATYLNVNTTSLKLNNVSSNVLEALNQRQLLSEQQHKCDTKLDALEEKLKALKHRMSVVELALKMNGEGANEYSLSGRTLESPTRNELLIIFKTNSSEGLLVNMLGEIVNSQQTGLAIYLSDGKVNVQYNTGQGPVTLNNPVLANNGQWVEAYFTRMGSSAALTVSNSHQAATVNSNHNAQSGSMNSTLHLTNATTVFLGGTSAAPRTRTARAVDDSLRNFKGTISSLICDQFSYHLWKPKTSNSNALYGRPRFANYNYPNNGQAASFFNGGFVQHESGEFATDSGYSRVEFDFRTPKSNGTLFVVTSEVKNTTVLAIFLQDGRVVVMVFSENNVSSVTSKRSNYNDGKWYHVSLVVTNGSDVTLAVLHNGTADNNSRTTSAPSLPPAKFIFFGSLPPNSSNATLPISEAFVGDLKDVRLNRNGTSTLVRRSFASSKGVSTEGVLKGEVISGAARFYGYRTATSRCSYVAVVTKQLEADSLTFTFKTSVQSGVLLFVPMNDSVISIYLYIALWHGRLLLLTQDRANTSQSKPVEIPNMKFNDNMWRTLHLNSSESGYSVFIDGSLVSSGWFGTSRLHPLRFNKPLLYIGGLPNDEELNMDVPVVWCFKGSMKDFKMNSNKIDLLSQESMGVSGGFVSPATPPPPPTPIPPTCAAAAGPLTSSTDPKEFGFTAGFSSNPNQQSYIGFAVNDIFSGISSLFTIELRPLTSNGLVLYIADNLTHPGQFISMEMIDGYIKYQVNFNPVHIQLKSSVNYVETKQWFKVHLLRIINFAAFLVPQTNEYHNANPSGVLSTNINLAGHLYIGGVPSHVKLHPLVTQRVGFSGCLKTLTFGSIKLSKEIQFDLRNPNVKSKTSACATNAQPGMGFNSSSWVNFGERTVSPSQFNLQLEFRTSSRDGVIVYFMNDTVGHKAYLKLEQVSGQLVLSHRKDSGNIHHVTWSATSSHLLCNMIWHKLALTGIGDAFNLTVDDEPAVSLALSVNAMFRGKLYAGGVPGSLSTPGSLISKGFLGCLKNLKLDNVLLDFGRAVDARHTTNGCPSFKAPTDMFAR